MFIFGFMKKYIFWLIRVCPVSYTHLDVYKRQGVLSPEAHDFSLDESFDSEEDSDHYEDYSSDAGNVHTWFYDNNLTNI